MRRLDIAEQQRIEAEARAGRWPPVDGVYFLRCYFGSPKEIAAMFPANLPTILIAGALVVPSNALDYLLEPAPGRILPSTRLLIYVVLFAMVVALQWYLILRLISTPRISASWRQIVCIAPIACVLLGLTLHGRWLDLFRVASLFFWIALVLGTLWQWRIRSTRETTPAESH